MQNPSRPPNGVSKESFDAALIPGMRERLAEAYRTLRQGEQDVFRSVLDDTGRFRAGIAHSRNCPLCGTLSDQASLLYHVHGMHIVQCPKCNLVYSQEVLNPEADEARYRSSNVMSTLIALHDNPAYQELESNKARYIVSQMSRFRPAAKTALLDVGCSTGAILTAAGEIGWSAFGIDLSAEGVEIARHKGLDAVAGSFPQDIPLGKGPFQAICLLDVLEHTEDPVGFLAAVAQYLPEGGILGLQVPNLNSLLIRIEGTRNNNICHGHWSYFTTDTLSRVSAKAGFRVMSVETIISEIDRIRAYDPAYVQKIAHTLTGKVVDFKQIDHRWLHDNLLGYKLFAILAK